MAQKNVSTKPKTKRVTFKAQAAPGSKVFIAGDFNEWNATAREMTDPKGNGNFSVTLNLAPGTYEYKLVINGAWCVDPECKDWVQNNLGTLNSVRKV